MNLTLLRTYHPKGTNGRLLLDGKHLCYTIELPWRDNQPSVSCIPEGSYPVVKRHSEKLEEHLLLENVPDRSLILIHPANNALKQLRGCIAPVSNLTGPGRGDNSRIVLGLLLMLVYAAIDHNHSITLTIVKDDNK